MRGKVNLRGVAAQVHLPNQRREPLAEPHQFFLLFVAVMPCALGVGVHPRRKTVQRVGVELHVVVAFGIGELFAACVPPVAS